LQPNKPFILIFQIHWKIGIYRHNLIGSIQSCR